MTVEKNIGNTERAVRIAVGVALLLLVPLAFLGPHSPWAFLGLIGGVPLVTGATGICPPYAWLGINTAAARTRVASSS